MVEGLDIAQYKERLEARMQELEDIIHHREEAQEDDPLQERMGRVSRMEAVQSIELEKNVEEHRKAELKRIELALKRIEDGSYGICLRCEEDIEPKRLDTDPSAPLCIKCAQG